MLNNLDLYKVRLIDELVKSESLTGAAKALGVTSSAVSQTIKTLERSLGKPLFIRVGKGVKPTPIALEIAKRARPFFSDLATVLEDSAELVAEVRIAAPPIFGATTLLDRIARVRAMNPGIRISITLLDTRLIVDQLTDGKVDFGFVDGGSHLKGNRDLLTKQFDSENLVLCCSQKFRKKHLTAGASLKYLKALAHIPYHQGKEGVHKWYLHHFGRVPDLKWTIAIDSPYGVLNAVERDWGLGVVPQSLIAGADDRIFAVSGPKSELKNQIFLAQNKNRVPTRFEKNVVSMLLSTQA